MSKSNKSSSKSKTNKLKTNKLKANKSKTNKSKTKSKLNFLYKVPASILKTDYHHNDNIINAAAKIIIKFQKHNEVVVIAEMQSGKTDVMKRLIYIINNYRDQLANINVKIDKRGVYVVLSASNINLKNQLKEKLSDIGHKVFHLNDIQLMLKNPSDYHSQFVEMTDSSLIIFDECHCDAECKKLIDKFRTKIETIAKSNHLSYHILGVSATAYEQVIAGYPKVIMRPGDNYYGIGDMFKSIESTRPVLFQAKNLEKLSKCYDLTREIDIDNYYYIFRLPGKKNLEDEMITNIIKIFGEYTKSTIETYIYDMSYKTNINQLINNAPSKPTIIFLKDKLRMGEYLNTRYVYLVHDNPNNCFAHTTVQSLLGRCCGYDKKSHQTIIYCDLEKAQQHYDWIQNNYNSKHVPINSKYIKKSTGEIKENCFY